MGLQNNQPNEKKFDIENLDVSIVEAYLNKAGISPKEALNKTDSCKYYKFKQMNEQIIIAIYAAGEGPSNCEEYILIEKSLGLFSKKNLDKIILKLNYEFSDLPYPVRVSQSPTENKKFYRLLIVYRNKIDFLKELELKYIMSFITLFNINDNESRH